MVHEDTRTCQKRPKTRYERDLFRRGQTIKGDPVLSHRSLMALIDGLSLPLRQAERRGKNEQRKKVRRRVAGEGRGRQASREERRLLGGSRQPAMTTRSSVAARDEAEEVSQGRGVEAMERVLSLLTAAGHLARCIARRMRLPVSASPGEKDERRRRAFPRRRTATPSPPRVWRTGRVDPGAEAGLRNSASFAVLGRTSTRADQGRPARVVATAEESVARLNLPRSLWLLPAPLPALSVCRCAPSATTSPPVGVAPCTRPFAFSVATGIPGEDRRLIRAQRHRALSYVALCRRKTASETHKAGRTPRTGRRQEDVPREPPPSSRRSALSLPPASLLSYTHLPAQQRRSARSDSLAWSRRTRHSSRCPRPGTLPRRKLAPLPPRAGRLRLSATTRQRQTPPLSRAKLTANGRERRTRRARRASSVDQMELRRVGAC